jgi:glucose dehydrogenase
MNTGISIAATVSLVLCGRSVAQQGDNEWLHYGGGQWNERHAKLTEIIKRNVAHLVRASGSSYTRWISAPR